MMTTTGDLWAPSESRRLRRPGGLAGEAVAMSTLFRRFRFTCSVKGDFGGYLTSPGAGGLR